MNQTKTTQSYYLFNLKTAKTDRTTMLKQRTPKIKI